MTIAEPVSIDVDRASAITITWDDGHTDRFPLAGLRIDCPCAGCRADRPEEVPDDLTIVDVKLAGAWGIRPTWSDGHNTGIYSWEYLRGL